MKTHVVLLVAAITLIPLMEDARGASAEKKEASPTRYSYTDLGSLGVGSCNLEGFKARNATGAAPTAAHPSGDAFLYHKGVMEDLGTLDGGAWSMGTAVNAAGQVTGNGSVGGNAYHAFLYTNGTMQDLGTLGGNSIGYAINASGHVTGDTTTGGAFLYKNGKMKSIPLSHGRGINAAGDVVGALGPHAYLYSHGGALTDLNTLLDPSDAPYITLQMATGISRNGLIVAKGVDMRQQSADGWAYLIADGKVTNLGSLGGQAAYPQAVNVNGDVVGQSLLSDFTSYRAFVFSDGTMTDLNTVIEPAHPLPPSMVLRDAYGITKNGLVGVYGSDSTTGVAHCYELKPKKAGAG